MTKNEKLKALQAEAVRLEKKGDNMSEADVERAEQLARQIGELKADINRTVAKTEELRRALRGDEKKLPSSSRSAKTAGFGTAIRDALAGQYGKTVLPINQPVNVQFNDQIVVDPQAVFSLSSLLQRTVTDAQSGVYLRQSSRTNNAAPVPLLGAKPLSDYALEKQTWELSTIAHMVNPIPKQWLDDISSLPAFLQSELAYGLNEATDKYVLNGGETESGDTATGLLNTDGVATQAFVSDALATIRTALGGLETAGVQANAIVINPADWIAIELLKDKNDRPLIAPDAATSPQRILYGVNVTLVSGIPAGTALIGDLQTVQLLTKGTYEILAQTTGNYVDADGKTQDLYSHNALAVRAETRVGLCITSTLSLVKASLTASGTPAN